MFHQDDIVEEIETKRQGKVTEAPEIPTDTRRWRVEFLDGKKPILRYFLESDLHLIRLIRCPHGITARRGPVSREEDDELAQDVLKEMAKEERMPFEEKPGTMWSVLIVLDGNEHQRIFLTASTAEDARMRAQSVVGNDGRKAVSAEAALYAVATAPLRITEFMWVNKVGSRAGIEPAT